MVSNASPVCLVACNCDENSLRADHVGDAAGEDAERLAHAPRLGQLPAAVAEQGERQVVLGRELHVRFDGVLADADDGGPGVGEVLVAVAERAGLLGAARGVVGRVEVHDHPLVLEVAQLHQVARLGRELEVGSHVTHLQGAAELRRIRVAHARFKPGRARGIP
jgi:hypothetical protein